MSGSCSKSSMFQIKDSHLGLNIAVLLVVELEIIVNHIQDERNNEKDKSFVQFAYQFNCTCSVLIKLLKEHFYFQ